MGVVTILGMGDTVAMLRSVLTSSSLSAEGSKKKIIEGKLWQPSPKILQDFYPRAGVSN